MKKAIKDIAGVLLGLFLIALSLIGFIIITPIALLWKLFVSIKNEDRKATDILQGTKEYFISIAAGFDQVSNVAFGGVFNAVFINDKSKHLFGNKIETISAVLGFNQKDNTLTNFGKKLVWLLAKLDKNHCLKSADYLLHYANELKKRRIVRRKAKK